MRRRYLIPDALAKSPPSGPLARYAIAFGFLAFAVALRIALSAGLGNTLSHPTVFIAILLATWYCGMGPALTIAIAGYPAIELLIRDHPFSGGSPEYLAVSLGLY
ncbi:MAG TPA: hypothetical protein VFB75_03835, partial [Burkholderiales bacterium]|nr:hypothetical protein [Burkholderiales bacterium]